MKLPLFTFGLLLAYNDAFVWLRRGQPGKPEANGPRNISRASVEQVNLTKGSDTIRSGSNGEISHFEKKLNIAINPGKYQIDDHRPIKVEAKNTTGNVSNRRFVRGVKVGIDIGLKPGKGKNGKSGKGRNRREIVNRLIENGGNKNRVGILNLGARTACKDGNIRVVDNGNVAGNKTVENGQKPGNNRDENGQKPGNNRVENGQKPENNRDENGHKPGNNRVENGQKPGNNRAENGQKPGNNRVENEQKPRKKEFEDKQECGNRRVENEPKSENKQESGQKPDKNKGGNDQKPCKVGKEHNDKVNVVFRTLKA